MQFKPAPMLSEEPAATHDWDDADIVETFVQDPDATADTLNEELADELPEPARVTRPQLRVIRAEKRFQDPDRTPVQSKKRRRLVPVNSQPDAPSDDEVVESSSYTPEELTVLFEQFLASRTPWYQGMPKKLTFASVCFLCGAASAILLLGILGSV